MSPRAYGTASASKTKPDGGGDVQCSAMSYNGHRGHSGHSTQGRLPTPRTHSSTRSSRHPAVPLVRASSRRETAYATPGEFVAIVAPHGRAKAHRGTGGADAPRVSPHMPGAVLNQPRAAGGAERTTGGTRGAKRRRATGEGGWRTRTKDAAGGDGPGAPCRPRQRTGRAGSSCRSRPQSS